MATSLVIYEVAIVSDEQPEQNVSLLVVLVGVLLLVGFMCWGFHAAAYAANEGQTHTVRIAMPRAMGIRSLTTFAWVAVTSLPSAPAVLQYTFTKQFWLVILTAVLQCLMVVGCLVAIAVDRKLNAAPVRKKTRKIPTPRGLS